MNIEYRITNVQYRSSKIRVNPVIPSDSFRVLSSSRLLCLLHSSQFVGLCAVLGLVDMKRHITGRALGLSRRASGSPKNTVFECSRMKRHVYHRTRNRGPLGSGRPSASARYEISLLSFLFDATASRPVQKMHRATIGVTHMK